ncbi:PREDICTED: protein RALF-like 9 [Camelina sativa]|uniref:Protein RALF-like 9 n=1 Tax=Camelina sativa TaxID=90675 RepID=A0ABM1QA48_CAMSA|nr:PREDICTED: protein RALF-like 9 [Camelina sativa]
MGMSKSVKVILSLALVVFLALAATTTEAKYIDYGDMNRGDHARNCDKARPESCKKVEANPYKRGCELATRCRRNPGGAQN